MDGRDLVKAVLGETEEMKEISAVKPRILNGGIGVLAGTAMILDGVRRSGNLALLLALLLAGTALLYYGIRCLLFCRRECVCVTNLRVLYQKVNWYGGFGQLESISLSEIDSVRLCHTTVMFGKRHSGEGVIQLKSGKSVLLPLLENAEYVVEAIGQELPRFSHGRPGGELGDGGAV